MPRTPYPRRTNLSHWAYTLFFPLSIAGSLFLIVVTWLVFGSVAAVKSSYVSLGLLLGAVIFYSTENHPQRFTARPSSHHAKLVYILVLLAVTGSVVLHSRLVPLLVLLPPCFFLLIIQLQDRTPSSRLLPQLIAVFAVTPVTKYLTTGFYFGGGDTFTHVRYVDQITAYGMITDTTEYTFFPVLHIIASIVSTVSGMTSYDGIQLLGIVASAFALLVVYRIAQLTSVWNYEAIYLTAAVVLIEPIFHFSSYFFPQSLGVILFLYLIYLAYRLNTDNPLIHRRLALVSVIIALLAVFTHHLTFFLFIPVFLLLFFRNLMIEYLEEGAPAKTHLFPLSLAYAIAFTYWTYHQQFIDSLIIYVGRLVEGRLVGGADGGPIETVVLGGQLQESTPISAAWSLVSAEGIYFIGLVAVFAVGVAVFLRQPYHQRHRLALIIIGIFSALLVLRTPLAHPDIDRLRYPLGFLFAFVLGIGLFDMLRSQAGQKTTVLIILLVVLLGTLAPLVGVAGDDLYEFDDGESLYQLYSAPAPERDLSEDELQQLQSAFAFTNSTNTTPSSLHVENNAMQRYGVAGSDIVSVGDDALHTDTPHLLYRTTWSEHRNTYSPSEGGETLRGTVVFDGTWVTQTSESEHKIYTTGTVGILHSSDDDPAQHAFSPNRSDTNPPLDSQSSDSVMALDWRVH